MAYITDTRLAGVSIADRFAAFRANRAEAAAKRKLYRTTFAELNVLSDRDLADLGIARGQIRAIALEAAYGA